MFCLMALRLWRRERLCLLCLLSAGFTLHAGCTGNAPTPRSQDQIASAPYKSDQIASAPYKPALTEELAEFDMPVRLKADNEFVRPSNSASDPAEPNWPGQRTQACATDYDGDGDLDLLVGDYHSQDGQMHGWVWLFRRR